MQAGEHPAIVVEVGPVGICTTHYHPAAFGECIGDRPQIERHTAKVLARTDREVLVVKEQGNAVFSRSS
jgi:hypothetical protein